LEGSRGGVVNWLAHLLLSEPTSEFRLGNLLPDLMSATELGEVPGIFQRGIDCHRRIDAFTDSHPLVRRSVRRLLPPYRRFAPVVMDVFYDHFLSKAWPDYSRQPLEEFLNEVHDSLATHYDSLPPAIQECLQRMRAENWLGSYVDIPGVRLTLQRISRRFRRQVALDEAVTELEQHYQALADDFEEFFPQLRAYVESDFARASDCASSA